MAKLIVTEVFEDYIVCLQDGRAVYIDTEGLAVLFKEGDEIHHIEHGFCDVYREGVLIAGLTNLFTRKFVR